MKKEKYNIICLSNQFYKNPGFSITNKHIVMEELAKRGHNIIFVDPPTRFKALKLLVKNRSLSLSQKYLKNFIVYTPINIFNFFPFSFISNKIHIRFIKNIISSWSNENNFKTILWIYHFDFPRIFDLDKELKPDIFVYDVVDNYEAFPEYSRMDSTNNGLVKVIQIIDTFFKVKIDQRGLRGKEWVKKRERNLAKRADLMFSSHPLLFEKFNKMSARVYYTPNASLYSKFSKKPKEIPDILNNIPSPKVLFSGSVDPYKVDVALLIKAAKKTPNISYCLIGPTNDSDSDSKINELKKIKNIYLVGPIPNAESFCYFFDAYIIPYVINDYTYYGCFPTKFLNAAATGIPLVVTDLPAYRGFEEIVYIGKNPEDFIKKIQLAVKDKSESKKHNRKKVASQNTWDHKVDKQLSYMQDFLNSKM